MSFDFDHHNVKPDGLFKLIQLLDQNKITFEIIDQYINTKIIAGEEFCEKFIDINYQWTTFSYLCRFARKLHYEEIIQKIIKHINMDKIQKYDVMPPIILASVYTATDSTEKTVEMLIDAGLSWWDYLFSNLFKEIIEGKKNTTENTILMLLKIMSLERIEEYTGSILNVNILKKY